MSHACIVYESAVCKCTICKYAICKCPFYKCVIYIASGQAADYGKQMDERLNILLDDTVKDVKLPAMNQDQGPLMHMEVTKDVNGWTNQVVKDFYRKNSVIEIDRVQ